MTVPVTYKSWDDVPDGLATKTQLKKQGLRPAKGQQPAAFKRNYYRGRDYCLYDVSQAEPRRQPSQAQLKALEKARRQAYTLRTCTGGCGRVVSPDDYARMKRNKGKMTVQLDKNGRYYCRHCRDRRTAARWAQGVLDDTGAIILDTETTGLDIYDQVIEVSIINLAGEPLLDTLVKHNLPGVIPPDVSRIHGITQEMVADAPTFLDIYPDLRKILTRASRIIIYNAEFDHRLLNQTRRAWKLPLFKPAQLECAMNWYAQWYGEWSNHHEDYRWQPLNGGHRALGDCQATLERIKKMAAEDLE